MQIPAGCSRALEFTAAAADHRRTKHSKQCSTRLREREPSRATFSDTINHRTTSTVSIERECCREPVSANRVNQRFTALRNRFDWRRVDKHHRRVESSHRPQTELAGVARAARRWICPRIIYRYGISPANARTLLRCETRTQRLGDRHRYSSAFCLRRSLSKNASWLAICPECGSNSTARR